MRQKIVITILMCFLLVSTGVAAININGPVVTGTNVSYYTVYANTSYVGTEGRIPFELWLTIVVSGAVFLIISLFIRRAEIISSLIATLLFGVASYISLVLILVTQDSYLASFITNETVVGNSTAVTIVSILQPVSYEIGSVWLSILCLGLFVIAALKVFLGISNLLTQAGEEADDTIKRGRIDTVNIPDMRDVANERYGSNKK